MLIPEQTMLVIDVTTLDVTDSRESGAKPKLHTNGAELHEEDLILCKTDLTDTEWYLNRSIRSIQMKSKSSTSQLQTR